MTIAAQTPIPHMTYLEKDPPLPVTVPHYGAPRGSKPRLEGQLLLRLALPTLPGI